MKKKNHYKNNLYFTVIHFRGSFMWNNSKTISHDYPPWNSIPSQAWGHLKYSTPPIKIEGAAFWYFSCLRKSLLCCYKMFSLSLKDCNINLWDQYADPMQHSIQIHFSFWYQIQNILFSPIPVQLIMASQYRRENNNKKKIKKTHHNFGHTCSLLQPNIGQRNNCTGTNLGVRESTWEQWPLKASLPPAQKTSYREQVRSNKDPGCYICPRHAENNRRKET